jgi:hypothetical protein
MLLRLTFKLSDEPIQACHDCFVSGSKLSDLRKATRCGILCHLNVHQWSPGTLPMRYH